ncbi:MAG: porin family protein [Chitinophagaceae bacterium]
MRPQMNLKKSAVVFALLVFGCMAAVSAQEQQTSMENSLRPKFGVKGGVNLSNLYVEDADDENLKLGLNLGFYAKIPIAKGFSIQPELIYSSKGSKLTYNNIILGRGEYRFNLNYVEVPVLAVINLASNINLQAGPYVSYLASANVKDMNEDGTIENAKDLNADNFNRFDYGLAGGIGIDVQNFTIGARYNYGLKEIGDSGLSGRLTRDSKNSVLSIFIGLGF